MNPDQSELKKKIAARIKALLAKTTEADYRGRSLC